MIISADIEMMELRLDDTPGDPHLRLVLADAYEEVGDLSFADFLRGMVRVGKWPSKMKVSKQEWGGYLAGWEERWDWWWGAGVGDIKWPVIYCEVPKATHMAMRCRLPIHEDTGKHLYPTYPTRRAAELALYEVWLDGYSMGEDEE